MPLLMLLRTVVVFVGFDLAVMVAVAGWHATWQSRCAKESKGNSLIYLFIAVMFTVAAVAAWFALVSLSDSFP